MDSYFELKEKGLSKVLTLNSIKCLECNTVLESKHQHHFISCKCGKSSCDGGTSYIRLMGDLDMMQNECEYIEMWEDGDKIRCINDSEQNTLKLNEIYTVDTSMNTTDNRVYVKENKRFSFLKSRFELVEE